MIIHKLSQMLKLIRLWLFYLKRFYFLVYILSTLGTEKDPLMDEKVLSDCQLYLHIFTKHEKNEMHVNSNGSIQNWSLI